MCCCRENRKVSWTKNLFPPTDPLQYNSFPVILIQPSLFPLSQRPYYSCSAHDVKRVGGFSENIKIHFEGKPALFASTLVVGHHLCRFVFYCFEFDRTLEGWAVSLYLGLISPRSCCCFRFRSLFTGPHP